MALIRARPCLPSNLLWNFYLVPWIFLNFRYKLLLEDVIKNTPDSHPDKKCLIEALEQIEHVAWHINEQLREHENSMKMVNIQKSLSGGFPKIIAPG